MKPMHRKPTVSRETDMNRSAPRPAPKAPEVHWTTEQWLPVVAAELLAQQLTATPAQTQALAAYMAMLQRWNATYNLTALRAPDEMRTHHLADCLTVVAPLAQRPELARVAQPSIVDVGSGGGLPGVVLAILMPQARVTCVDAVGKKVAFIRQVAAELALPNLKGEHLRVQQFKGQHQLVTSRAFASLTDFTEWTRHLLAPGAVWAAMKGKAPEPEELQALMASGVGIERVQALQVPGLDADRCLVWMQPTAP